MSQNCRSRTSNTHQRNISEPQRRNRSREFESAAKRVKFEERKYGGEAKKVNEPSGGQSSKRENDEKRRQSFNKRGDKRKEDENKKCKKCKKCDLRTPIKVNRRKMDSYVDVSKDDGGYDQLTFMVKDAEDCLYTSHMQLPSL